MNIQLHIERLILQDVDIATNQGPALQAAVQAELTRLLSNGGMATELAKGAAVPRITATAMQFSKGNSPAQLGRQIAQSVYGGIGHG